MFIKFHPNATKHIVSKDPRRGLLIYAVHPARTEAVEIIKRDIEDFKEDQCYNCEHYRGDEYGDDDYDDDEADRCYGGSDVLLDGDCTEYRISEFEEKKVVSVELPSHIFYTHVDSDDELRSGLLGYDQLENLSETRAIAFCISNVYAYSNSNRIGEICWGDLSPYLKNMETSYNLFWESPFNADLIPSHWNLESWLQDWNLDRVQEETAAYWAYYGNRINQDAEVNEGTATGYYLNKRRNIEGWVYQVANRFFLEVPLYKRDPLYYEINPSSFHCDDEQIIKSVSKEELAELIELEVQGTETHDTQESQVPETPLEATVNNTQLELSLVSGYIR